MGSWLIHDPVTGQTGDGAFRVNQRTRPRDFTDGQSQTLCAVDVKAYTSYIRNVDTIDPTLPGTTDFFEGVTGELKMGPSQENNSGHTVWCDGRVHHTGFTTVFGPNTRVTYTHGGEVYDIDYNSQQEGRSLTRPTFAAVTARSFHDAGVNALFMDGSVRFVSNSIALPIWRSMGTAGSGEIIDSSQLD
jgi:prepilin-type processing-associated H-X9-DG protein